ncbi:MAG: serine/threonine-protein kinase, partial [Eubacteriales bacterium]|nr:serine/threonine-protein kinase [Eubacteriales bacterium]
MNDPRIAEDVLEFKQQYVEFLREHVHVPEEIARKYTVDSLLSESKRSRVFLMTDRETESQVILKVFDTPAGAEAEPILRRLHHPAIPKFMEMHRAGGKTYLVREYFEGRSLAEILQAEGRLPAPEACAIAMRVCDVLSYLHSRKKPVIYRDIKAENIIITKEQRVKLIDFDISREYNEAAGNDTAYYGTRAYSPPEQFGYAQTDARTDVYSLGVLLLFMLTGSREKEGVAGVKAPYQHILEKCLAFAPRDRYPSAAALQKALDKAERRPGTLRVRSAVLLVLAALVLGVGAGMYAERRLAPPAAVQAEGEAVFSSPLIEQAVRLALGKAENEPVYP